MTPRALITGAAGGIGRALVQAFHDAGFRVVATDFHEPSGDLACAAFVPADLARFAAEADYAGEVVAQLRAALNGGGLDVLIHNAAVQILGGAESLDRQDWHTTLGVNLLSPFLLSQALLPDLEQARGCILNIGSIHARLTKANFVAYATSKAALAGMTRALAVDLGPRVRVNCIEPAAIETDMLRAGFAGKAEAYAQLERCHPRQCIGRPEEVAQLALAIAKGNMSFMHGACIGLDGGIGGRLHDPE